LGLETCSLDFVFRHAKNWKKEWWGFYHVELKKNSEGAITMTDDSDPTVGSKEQ
jgi:hypothetical protein